MQQSYGLNKI